MITDIDIQRIDEENHQITLNNQAMIQLHDIMISIESLSSVNIHHIQQTLETIFVHQLKDHAKNEDYKMAFNYLNDVLLFLNQNYTSASQFNYKIQPVVDRI